jgi:hypothetical protein
MAVALVPCCLGRTEATNVQPLLHLSPFDATLFSICSSSYLHFLPAPTADHAGKLISPILWTWQQHICCKQV